MLSNRAAAFAFASLMFCMSADAFAQARQQKAPAQPPQQQKEEKTFPKDSSWSLRAMNGKPIPAGAEATLKIDGQFRGSGFAGCNTWSATMWPVRGQRFAVGPVAVTKKSCAPQIMAFEKSYLAALHSAPTWDLVNGLLEVKSAAGTLSFARGL